MGFPLTLSVEDLLTEENKTMELDSRVRVGVAVPTLADRR